MYINGVHLIENAFCVLGLSMLEPQSNKTVQRVFVEDIHRHRSRLFL